MTGILMCLFAQFPDKPYDQAGAADGEDNAGNPAVADPDQVSDESADETADDSQQRVPQEALGAAVHDLVGGETAQGTDAQGDQQVNQHFSGPPVI